MAMGCEDVSPRLVELLYGESSPDERAPLEAHVAGCARCRGELAGLRATRSAARRALDADAPPEGARQSILRAAAAALATKQAQPIAARPAPERSSFWDRLRSRWTLPTFATVGAVAVVVLASKVFLEPEKTVELGRQAVHPAAAEAPAAPARMAQPETQGTANALPPAEKRAPGEEDLRPAEQPAADKPVARSSAGAPHERRRAAPSEGRGDLGVHKGAVPAGRAAKADLDGLIDASGGARPAPEPSKREFAPPPRAAPASPPASAAAAGKDEIVDHVSGSERPAPGRAGGGRLQSGSGAAPPPVQAAKKAKKASLTGDDFAEAPAASASAPEAAPSPPAAAPTAAARDEAKEAPRAEAKAAPKPAGESPVARADRLYAEGRWAEAARAYRELLRRDPHSADAPRWRQRLATAEAAIAPQGPPAASPPPP